MQLHGEMVGVYCSNCSIDGSQDYCFSSNPGRPVTSNWESNALKSVVVKSLCDSVVTNFARQGLNCHILLLY